MRGMLRAMLLALATAVPAAAEEALVLTGVPGAAGPVTLDMAALRALPRTEIATATIWTEGVQRFAGVELRALLDAHGIAGGSIRVVALNDYSVEIPEDEVRAGEALLAYERNGAPMPVRDKGPLWVVYPYDSRSDLRNEVIYSRSVWQVSGIVVAP